MPYTYDFPRPVVTADVAAFRVRRAGLEVLLIRRGKEPFLGSWALPGGFVDIDEPLQDAAEGELEEETGLTGLSLVQFHAFGKPGRDPRGRTVTVAYATAVPPSLDRIRAGDDAAEATWHPAAKPPPLAFDHDEALAVAIAWLRRHLHDPPFPFAFLDAPFPGADLARVLTAVSGKQASDAEGVESFLASGRLCEEGTGDSGVLYRPL